MASSGKVESLVTKAKTIQDEIKNHMMSAVKVGSYKAGIAKWTSRRARPTVEHNVK